MLSDKFNFGNKRKGQIGATLTWIAAFLVIFFVMLLFIGASVLIAATKGFATIEFFGQNSLNMQREAILFLNTPFVFENSNVKLRDELLRSDLNGPQKQEMLREMLRQAQEKYPYNMLVLEKDYWGIENDLILGYGGLCSEEEKEKGGESISQLFISPDVSICIKTE